jgi:inosose dehydratase
MTTTQIKWGYAFNQWKLGWQGFARVDDNIRALKVTSACGFRAVELPAGTGPWDPLGRPESLAINFGSVRKFGVQLADWGIDRITSVFFDPGQMSFEELHHGLMATQRADHAGILAQARIHAEGLAELGGECLVVPPFPSYWKQGAINAERMQAAADCWNQVGAMARDLGLKTVLHIDALSALRTTAELDQLLALCPADRVGLAFDTAELTIAGHDVVALYRRYHTRVQHFHFKDALAIDTLGEYRLPNAERAMILAGGEREIQRWFGELGTGLVDFEALLAAMNELRYNGWVIVESDKGPQPVASSVMLNSWYLQYVLKVMKKAH